MTDKLKKFVTEHRNEMDLQQPSSQVWNALSKQVGSKPSLFKALLQKGIVKALLVAAVVPAAIVIYTVSKSTEKSNEITATKENLVESLQSPAVSSTDNTTNKNPDNDKANELNSTGSIPTNTELANEVQKNKTEKNTVSYLPNGAVNPLLYNAAKSRQSKQFVPSNGTEPVAYNMASVITNLTCNGDHSGKIDITQSGNNGPYSFNWAPVNRTTEDITGLSAGTYTLSVTDAQSKVAVFNFTVTEPAAISLSTSATLSACGLNNGTATASINAGGTAPFNFSWSNGATSASIANLASGTYKVAVTDNNGCISRSVVNIANGKSVTSAFTSSALNGSAPLKVDFVNNSSGATNYLWKFGDGITENGMNANHVYYQEGTYHACLIALNSDGCKDSLCNDIVVKSDLPVFVPNILTPNGDGSNDFFIVKSKGTERIERIEMTIFSPAGPKIYGTIGESTASWDGRDITGKLAESGTYFLIGTAYGLDNKQYEFKGFITLIR